MIEIKKRLYEYCQHYLSDKRRTFEQEIQTLQSLANEETKSSAGDKYETTRAMIQLEIEKHTLQLAELAKQKSILDTINPERISERAQPGSLVLTEQAAYFLSISAGKVTLSGKDFICISEASPIGAKLNKLKAGDSFSFNNIQQRIFEVH